MDCGSRGFAFFGRQSFHSPGSAALARPEGGRSSRKNAQVRLWRELGSDDHLASLYRFDLCRCRQFFCLGRGQKSDFRPQPFAYSEPENGIGQVDAGIARYRKRIRHLWGGCGQQCSGSGHFGRPVATAPYRQQGSDFGGSGTSGSEKTDG